MMQARTISTQNSPSPSHQSYSPAAMSPAGNFIAHRNFINRGNDLVVVDQRVNNLFTIEKLGDTTFF